MAPAMTSALSVSCLDSAVPQDYNEAVKWYRLSADKGNEVAQKQLGQMYYFGTGVPKDYKEAAKWLRFAADQDDELAQSLLGGIYSGGGNGVSQDYKEAVKWYRLTSNKGNAYDQFFLGMMYEKGEGVPQSRVMAFALYNVSATNNPDHNPAIRNREELSRIMTAAEIAEGQSLSREMSKPGMLLKVLDR